MAVNLRRTEEGLFEIDVRGALDSCSAPAAAHTTFSELAVQAEGHVLLLPAPREQFLASLLKILSTQRVAWLASSEKILARSNGPVAQLARTSSSTGHRGLIRLDPEQDFLALLTSGTTGSPQIFSKKTRQLLGEAIVLRDLLQLGPSDVVLSSTAPHHVYGLLFSVFAPWAAGAQVVTHPDNEPDAFHPEKIARLVTALGVTRLITVPAHLKALVAARVELPGVTTIVSSAAPLDAEDATRAAEMFGARVLDVLGSTETGGIATREPVHGPAYTPLPGVVVRTDEDDVLFVQSAFLEDPKEPWRSADRARVQADGTFLHLGRADGIVKVGGKRTSLQEIEMLARTLPGVRDAACLSRSVKSLRGQELLLAIESDEIFASSVKSALKNSLDPVFVPRRIRVTPQLPRTDRGKLDRSALLELFCTKMTPEPNHVEIRLPPLTNSPRFAGHFPENELLPALAQLSDLILPHIRQNFGGGELAELTRVKWTDPIRQTDDLLLLLDRKPSGVKFELRAERSQATVVTCSGTLSLHPLQAAGQAGSA